MRVLALLVSFVLITGALGCDTNTTTAGCCGSGVPAARVVNGYPTPINVLVDGGVSASSLPAGTIDTIGLTTGSHVIAFSPSGTSVSSAGLSVAIAAGSLPTLVTLRSSTSVPQTVALDDTNDIVPGGATKLRVLHFAPNAGTLQVYRTQPDYQQPIAWQFPFTYQSDPTSLSAPFYQSTVGTWEVRIWQTPADASGWSTAPVKVVLPMVSGEKHTIIILDKAGGGVRAEVI